MVIGRYRSRWWSDAATSITQSLSSCSMQQTGKIAQEIKTKQAWLCLSYLNFELLECLHTLIPDSRQLNHFYIEDLVSYICPLFLFS